jgi:cell division protease FtsH
MAKAALDEAVALLRPRRSLMDSLVNILIEQETIEGDLFRKQVENYEGDTQPLSPGKIAASSAI